VENPGGNEKDPPEGKTTWCKATSRVKTPPSPTPKFLVKSHQSKIHKNKIDTGFVVGVWGPYPPYVHPRKNMWLPKRKKIRNKGIQADGEAKKPLIEGRK